MEPVGLALEANERVVRPLADEVVPGCTARISVFRRPRCATGASHPPRRNCARAASQTTKLH